MYLFIGNAAVIDLHIIPALQLMKHLNQWGTVEAEIAGFPSGEERYVYVSDLELRSARDGLLTGG